MFDERLQDAAQRVLQGDEAMVAAHDLERVLHDDYPDDDRFDALLEALAFYAPGQGPPYLDAEQLRRVTRTALTELNDSSSGPG